MTLLDGPAVHWLQFVFLEDWHFATGRALDDYDVPDPYGRGDEAHEVAARLMAGAVERIAEGLTP